MLLRNVLYICYCMICPHCHETINDNAKKCSWCMNYIDWNVWISNNQSNVEWYRMKRFWASIIDWLLNLLIIPIFLNLYYYLRYWYTIWKKIMKIRIVNQSDNSIPSIKSLLTRNYYKWWRIVNIIYLLLLSVAFMLIIYLVSWYEPMTSFRDSFSESENYLNTEWAILSLFFLPMIIWQLIWMIVPFHLIFKKNWIWLHDKWSKTRVVEWEIQINKNRAQSMEKQFREFILFLTIAIVIVFRLHYFDNGWEIERVSRWEENHNADTSKLYSIKKDCISDMPINAQWCDQSSNFFRYLDK